MHQRLIPRSLIALKHRSHVTVGAEEHVLDLVVAVQEAVSVRSGNSLRESVGNRPQRARGGDVESVDLALPPAELTLHVSAIPAQILQPDLRDIQLVQPSQYLRQASADS